MRISFARNLVVLLALAAGAASFGVGHAAGRLEASQAWIRAAPPGAMMLAGYAVLRNSGNAPLTIVGAQSADFGGISLHESIEENGVEHMRPLGKFQIASGASVSFAPGGKHFMLMQPGRELTAGDVVRIHIATEAGDGASVDFVVRDSMP